MRVAVSWSGGKDAAWALHLARQLGHEVVALIATFDRDRDRIPIHGTRREMVRRQAAAAELPLVEVDLAWPCPDHLYRFALSGVLRRQQSLTGLKGVLFGDLHLADIRAFREAMLAELGLQAVFPLWGMRSDLLASSMLGAGVVAHLVSVDPARIDPRWAGHLWDRKWIDLLPSTIDPCGENGEFHTLVSSGPMFTRPVPTFLRTIEDRYGMACADFSPDQPER